MHKQQDFIFTYFNILATHVAISLMIKTEEFHGYCALYMIHTYEFSIPYIIMHTSYIATKLTVKTQKFPYIVAFLVICPQSFYHLQ